MDTIADRLKELTDAEGMPVEEKALKGFIPNRLMGLQNQYLIVYKKYYLIVLEALNMDKIHYMNLKELPHLLV